MAGFSFKTRRAASGPPTRGGRIGASLFFVLFLGFGLLFSGLIGSAVFTAVKTRFWEAVPCTIMMSDVTQTPGGDHVVTVTYEYQRGGRSYRSDRYALEPDTASFTDYSKAARRAARFAAGGGATCYVDGSNSRRAVLAHGSPLIGLFIVLPLVFVFIGGGGIWCTWKTPSRRERADGSTAPHSISSKAARPGSGIWAGVLFGGVFVAAGSALLIGLTVVPALRVLDARSWKAVPCTVISSTVRSHSSDDGTTYSVDIFYEYELNGATHRSNRYSFQTGSSSGRDGKQAIVGRYPAGRAATCYVDPAAPHRAVIERGFVPGLFVGLFGLIFVAAGLVVVILSVKHVRGKRRTLLAAGPGGAATVDLPDQRTGDDDSSAAWLPPMSDAAAGPAVLERSGTPLGRLAGISFFAVIWNAIVIGVGWRLVGDWSWGLGLFMVPFALVGLGLIGGVVYCVLALRNPRPVLQVSRRIVAPGESFDLDYAFVGVTDRMEDLQITLEGREEAVYQRGTKTYTDRNTFFETAVVHVERPGPALGGRYRVALPAGCMHSFESAHNRIIWSLRVKGDIPRWPDVKDEFKLTVLPAEMIE